MTVRIGLVGTGFMARTHLEAYASVPDAEVVTVVSRNEKRGRELAAAHHATWTGSLDEMLGSDDIDAVDLCVPTDLHVTMAEAAFESGKHVLVEKPIALDLDGADRLIAAAERTGLILMVGMVLRFWPEYRHLLELTHGGSLGDIQSLTAYRLSAPPAWNEWMALDERSGGVIVDLMIHDIDLALEVAGPVREVSTVATADRRHVHAQLAHESGAVTSLEASHAMPENYPFACGYRVLGTRGAAQYDFQVGETTGAGNLGTAASVPGMLVVPSGGTATSLRVEQADPFVSELSEFVASVAAGTASRRCTPTQARSALAVARVIADELT